ncbi:hypothetical protein [Halobaculum sp. P14]|uniref:hypothetical protein n=1 Tax=Halobaculum sp. P14 TaxID=3421638 RepID=UPI003EB92F69
MQRRAAAIYVAFFVVVGAASFSLIATASAPHLSFDNPNHELAPGESITVDGTQYRLTEITAEMQGGGGGGHGGGGPATLVRSGTLEWTNQSSRYTVEWANGSTVTYDGEDWTVVVESGDDPTQFTLRENIDRSAILQNDSSVENETTTVDGQTYVVRKATENGSRELVPADDYFPEPATREYAEGDEVSDVQNHTATVASVTGSGATLEWFAPRTNTIDVADTANVTLGSTTYFAHFPNNQTLVLTQNFEQYDEYQHQSSLHTTMKNGLWGVTILSGVVAFLMTGLAYLPSRY